MNNNNFQLNSKILPTSICLSLLVILIPLLVFFVSILYNTKRLLHVNTRILLTVVPLSVVLNLVSRAFLLLLVVFCENGNITSIFTFLIFYTSFFANFLLNALPISLLFEKLFSTIFCKYYEKKKSLRWISSGILAVEMFLGILFSIIRSQTISTIEENISTHHLELVLFQVSVTLPVLFLLFWNIKLSSFQFASNPSHSQNISCRYQLRENCRTLQFCLFFVFLLSTSTFIHILFHVIINDESSFNINYSIQHFGPFEEVLTILPSYLALFGTLLGHKSLRQSLLSRFGFNISVMERSNIKQAKHLHINTVDDGFLSSFSSNRTARVSDAKSVNELIRDAHFDILQSCWDKKPEK